MENKLTALWENIRSKNEVAIQDSEEQLTELSHKAEIHPLDIPENDPLLSYFLSSPGVVEVEKLNLESPTLEVLREEGMKLTLPLVSQGELIGLLNLGPRMSEQEYSTDDKRLLDNLATQAAPALRVAQLARQQQKEAQKRERLTQELKIARVIQQTLLPQELPALEGWQVAAHWQPASEVGGDFYDFIDLPDGRMGILIADVTDKGVPAALVMATTRSILRSAAERLISPGKVLKRTNELLVPDIPPNMFVTCLYFVFDPSTGQLEFANAGHNLPFLCSEEQVKECRATGMPLGLMPGMDYEEKFIEMAPGDRLLLYSDGLSEAHNPEHEMFGTPRIGSLLANQSKDEPLIEFLFDELLGFTGDGWEQEDDVTFVTLERLPTSDNPDGNRKHQSLELAEFSIDITPGNEREAVKMMVSTVEPLDLPEATLKRLETAVAEATMNAMEHGNKYDPDKPVQLRVKATQDIITIQISDLGERELIPEAVTPDLDAKLAGTQSPRGWGLYLIKNMVDDLRTYVDEDCHTIELTLKY